MTATLFSAPDDVAGGQAPAQVAPVARTQVCRRCGGSGILRVSDLSHRTCLDCLGQGKFTTLVQTPWSRAGLSGTASVSAAG